MTAQLGRFIVRDIAPWEGEGVLALTGDPEVTRYLGIRTHTSVTEATDLIATYQKSPTKWQAICIADTPFNILGIVGLEVIGHQATLTLMFRNNWKARGAGVEFARPFVQWIFTHPTIWRVWSHVHVDNLLGQRATERTGAIKEGRMRRFAIFPNISTEPQDCFMYAIVRE